MNKIDILLVGIGGYGAVYAQEVIENPSEKINVAGVVEPFPEKSVWSAEFTKRNIPIYPDMESFYKEKSADLAIISTPIFLHTKHIICALNNGSNVMCEKPLCSDENDIEIIKNAQEKSGKFISIGYQMSFSDAVTNLKNDIIEGKFGKLLEMKVLVLRPRDRNYFGRGVGWAGKIKTNDGMLVYDSIANNSAAHYLFNMIFVMGEYGKAATAENISAELLRANDIENFDVSKIQFEINGAKAVFIGAHPVNKTIEPIFEYKFEKGSVYYSMLDSEDAANLMPEAYTEYGDIVAVMNNGEKINYGFPSCPSTAKIYTSADAIIAGNLSDGACGIDAAAVHTRMINKIQKEFEIKNIKSSAIKEENGLLYAEGLFEKLTEVYKNTDISILDYAEE